LWWVGSDERWAGAVEDLFAKHVQLGIFFSLETHPK
jgi:hypothetical protein